MRVQDCSTLAAILGFQIQERHEKYLGLPSVVGSSKKLVLKSIRDRVWNKMKGWNTILTGFLSIPGIRIDGIEKG
uniref:Uncharacterized protein n=1 Tax=Utricularia reniformis TaxID=192314 RepID=A0A1Y0B197_9LAMI|nr:hypothetical protein AEK19_MT0934 [Utricularia reniformis]ART31158.1 hypothetical protein AEK19_MT0934 [Utricularia reniformis]